MFAGRAVAWTAGHDLPGKTWPEHFEGAYARPVFGRRRRDRDRDRPAAVQQKQAAYVSSDERKGLRTDGSSSLPLMRGEK